MKKILEVRGQQAEDILGILNSRPLRCLPMLIGQSKLFKMGLAIISSVDADYLHEASVFMRFRVTKAS